jgi:FkbM family methyltransferase
MNEWDIKSIDFDLTPESVVVELGGYQGRWGKLIADKYHPRLFAFEPQAWAAEKYRKRLGKAAQCFTYGLGTQNAVLPMGEFETDGCSFTRTTRTQGMGELREYHSALAALDIGAIDLMLMNIEGYEFTLLPHIMPLLNVKWFMIQFHCDTVQKFSEFYQWRADMTQTHNLRWDYGTTLSAWERKV